MIASGLLTFGLQWRSVLRAVSGLLGAFRAVPGALAVVPAFNLLVPAADVLGTEHFPAPGVQVWASVSTSRPDWRRAGTICRLQTSIGGAGSRSP